MSYWPWLYPAHVEEARRFVGAIDWHVKRGNWPIDDAEFLAVVAETDRKLQAFDSRQRYQRQRRYLP